jgi:hypothetical protein
MPRAVDGGDALLLCDRIVAFELSSSSKVDADNARSSEVNMGPFL